VREAIGEGQPTLVFASTRHHVEFLHTLMTREGIDAACVYGAMDQVSLALPACYCNSLVFLLTSVDVTGSVILLLSFAQQCYMTS